MRHPALLAHVLATLTMIGLGSELWWVIDTGSLASWGLGEIVVEFVLVVVGWILAWRRPDVSLGWILLGISLLGSLRGPTGIAGDLLAPTAPGAAAWLLWYGGDSQWSWIPLVGLLFTQLPQRFPDGRLPSPRWRWFSIATIVVIVVCCGVAMTVGETVGDGIRNPTYVPGTDALAGVVIVGLLLSFVGSLASLFVRYRRAGEIERAQLRWVFWSLAIVVGLLLVDWAEAIVFGGDDAPGLAGQIAGVGQIVTTAAYLLIPISILTAVLRRGLYSIDRIISRTAAYATVTLAIVVVYGGAVILAGLVLPDLPAVGVAAATLLAAAIFLPLLRAVRRLVDRRFDRAQYDAQQVVDAFGERIRTGADPHGATDDLLAAVQTALQPSAIGVWRRDAA